MAATYAKGLPASVQHLAHSGDRLADVPLHPHRPLASGSAFRHDAASSSSAADSDFAAFQEAQAAQLGDPGLSRAWAGAASSSAPGGIAHAGPSASSTLRNAVHEGAELSTLLSGGGLLDAVDGDWEAELLARQNEPWRVELESRMPQDPFTSARGSKGKGRADEAARAGDMSPTSNELLSSLSSLDLADKAYLRTLLAQDPTAAFDDYFSRGSYTDDVYGLPPAVQRLFDKAAQQDERVGVEEGRKKAVRRLGLVLRHMQAADQVEVVREQTERLRLADGAAADGAAAQIAAAGMMAMGQQDPVQHHHMHSAYAPSQHASHFASRFRQQPGQADATFAVQQPPSASHGPYTVPSSLSESAFITITPPPTSPPPLLAPHPPAHAHEQDTTWDTPAPSTATLLAHHSARLRSNSGGRYGPDWEGRGRSTGGHVGEEHGREGRTGGAEGKWDVREGRTH